MCVCVCFLGAFLLVFMYVSFYERFYVFMSVFMYVFMCAGVFPSFLFNLYPILLNLVPSFSKYITQNRFNNDFIITV